MQHLSPSEIIIDYKFLCPECDSLIWVNAEAYNDPRYIMVCYCGFKAKVAKQKNVASKKPLGKAPKYTAIIDLLCSNGFNKNQLLKISKELPDNLSDDDVTKILISKYEKTSNS